jgi:hypothetical protein
MLLSVRNYKKKQVSPLRTVMISNSLRGFLLYQIKFPIQFFPFMTKVLKNKVTFLWGIKYIYARHPKFFDVLESNPQACFLLLQFSRCLIHNAQLGKIQRSCKNLDLKITQF